MALLSNIAKNSTSALRNVTSTARKATTNIAKNIRTTASSARSLTNRSSSSLSAAKNTISSLSSAVKRSSGSSGSTLKNLTKGITSLSSGKSSLSNTFKTLTSSAKNNNVLSSINSVVKKNSGSSTSSLSNLLKKYSSNGTSSLTNSFKTLKNTISSNTSSAKNGLLTSITSAFSNKSRINVSDAIKSLKKNSNTGSALSSLFSKASNLKNSIKPLNVFSGLTEKIGSVKTNLQNGLSGITKIDTMGVLGLSTTLGGAAERIQTSFQNWKGKLANLVNGGSMSGIIGGSIGEAKSKMESLFGNFHGYASQMASKLFGISEDSGLMDGTMMSSSSSEAGVLGAVEKLDSGVSGKYDINNYPDGQYDRAAAKERSVIVANYLVENGGFTKDQAAAMVGVYWDENGCYPGEVMKDEYKKSKNSYGAGIGSWTSQSYKNECLKAAGLPANTPIESLTMKQQADMIIAMSQTGENKTYYNALKRCDNIEDASATAVVITGGVGFSNNWKTHPTQADAKNLANWYANRNDSKYGYSDYHHNLDTRRLEYAKEIRAAMD